MPNEKEVELLPKTYFHLLFKAYTEIINNQKQNSDLYEFDCPYGDLFYEMCDTKEKVKSIVTDINNDTRNSGCFIYTEPEKLKFSTEPKKLLSFVDSYLDSIIVAEKLTLPPKTKQSLFDCARVLPYKKQIQVFKIIIDNNLVEYVDSFDFDYLMLTKYGGDGNSVHKRFCVDELLLILQREKLIDRIEVREEKDYYDKDYNGEKAQLPFYRLTKLKKNSYNNGFWYDTINKTIGYGENEITPLHFPENPKPIKKAHLLFVFIRNQGKPLSDEDLIKELDEQQIRVPIDKLTSLRSDALLLLKLIDDQKEFKISNKKINGVYFYSLTSKNKTN